VVHPDAVTRLLEVVSTAVTAPEVTRTLRSVCRTIGAATVSCDDRAGRLVERLLTAYLNDAAKMLQSGYASADDIDLAMREGCALPQGPIESMDQRGLDAVLAAQHRLFAESREAGHAPAQLLIELVAMGQLGLAAGTRSPRAPALSAGKTGSRNGTTAQTAPGGPATAERWGLASSRTVARRAVVGAAGHRRRVDACLSMPRLPAVDPDGHAACGGLADGSVAAGCRRRGDGAGRAPALA
jgi:3-hydroxyacyl-CoA dehydrogenase